MDSHSAPAVLAAFERASTDPITVDVTTTGCRSGTPRRIEIWMVKVGDRLVMGGTPGPRDWLANVRADPAMIVHLKNEVVADLQFDAIEVTDPVVRREIWTHPSTEWYRGQSDLDTMIRSAPTVELVTR